MYVWFGFLEETKLIMEMYNWFWYVWMCSSRIDFAFRNWL